MDVDHEMNSDSEEGGDEDSLLVVDIDERLASHGTWLYSTPVCVGWVPCVTPSGTGPTRPSDQ